MVVGMVEGKMRMVKREVRMVERGRGEDGGEGER